MYRLRLLRSVSVSGRRMLPGTELMMDGATAARWIDTGVAVLVDDDDVVKLAAATKINGSDRWTRPINR